MAGFGIFRPSTHCVRRSTIKLGPYSAVKNRVLSTSAKCCSEIHNDYLHESLIPTMYFQKSLPRLPLPKLQDTCRRYLASQKPLLSADEFSQTKAIVDAFQRTEGPDLSVALRMLDKENKHTNYISGPWFDMYLKARESIVLNYNPFITYNNDPKPENMTQLIRATNMVVSAARLMRTLRDNQLEPELFHLNPKKTDTTGFKKIARMMPESIASYYAIINKVFPLDMSQYSRLFNSTRIPLHERDDFVTDPHAKHVLAVYKGNFYTFDVLDEDGSILPAAVIHANIDAILQDTSPPSDNPLGYLTSENRDTWATLRHSLSGSSPDNVENLKLVDTAMLCLCLDDTSPDSPDGMTRQMLYGDGSNRWFDKSLQVIVCDNGMMGVNFEHAWGDGVAVLRFFNEVYKDNSEKPAISSDSKPNSALENIRKIHFDLEPVVIQGIHTARENYNAMTSRLNVCTKQNFLYGKDFLKKVDIGSDALMQLSFQMAFYRLTGKTAPSYESCSTAAFKHGRTETLRPATMETQQCSVAFGQDSGSTDQEKRALVKACSDKHYTLTKEALMGKGWDRHMFGMRNIAAGLLKPDIFRDPAYANINHIILSTSTLTSPAVLIGGFAPVTGNGFGIGYSISADNLGVNVASYPDSCNVRDFVECLNSSWEDLYQVLNK